jgi:peptidoglycan hydrolase-like protein with peptidoglycan-binding domain
MVAPNYSSAIELAPIASSNGFFSTLTRWTPRIVGAIVGILIIGLGNAAMALQRGDGGPAVRELQEALTSASCYDGPTNGTFGEMTENGVMTCQRRWGLTPDGIAGPKTLAKLQGRIESRPEAQSYTPPYAGRANPNPGVSSREGLVERGASSDTVSFIQTKLKSFNFYTGAIDGEFGGQTETAVRQFQRAVMLPIDGKVGTPEMSAFDSYQPPTSTTPSSSTIVLSRNQLRMGDSGTDVVHLQDRLRAAGSFQDDSTGRYRTLTRDAVIDFQRNHGLRATGVADAMTLEALGLKPGTQIGQAPLWNPSQEPFITPGSSTPIHQSLPTRAVTPNSRYVVVIPKQNEQTLGQVRRVIGGAQMFTSSKGDYIVAGTSTTRAWAEKRSNYLRSVGLDARVDYQ